MSEKNPWLDVTAEDYLGHMGSEAVGQLPVLRDLFSEALARFAPRRLLVLGCGRGTAWRPSIPRYGARHGRRDKPEYLARLRERFPAPSSRWSSPAVTRPISCTPGAFDLVHAALIFEYLDWERLVPRIARAVTAGGG